MSIAIDYLEASKKGTFVDGKNITLQVYNAELNHLVNIEQIVKELIQLADDYKKTTCTEPLETTENSVDNFQFGVLHQIYRFVVSLINAVTLLITFNDNELKRSNKSTIVNVMMLNIISFTTKFSRQIKQFIMVYAENPQLINVSKSFILAKSLFKHRNTN